VRPRKRSDFLGTQTVLQSAVARAKRTHPALGGSFRKGVLNRKNGYITQRAKKRGWETNLSAKTPSLAITGGEKAPGTCARATTTTCKKKEFMGCRGMGARSLPSVPRMVKEAW